MGWDKTLPPDPIMRCRKVIGELCRLACSIDLVSYMVDVRELLKYNEVVRHRYFESLANLSWEEFTKNREASFNSFRDIFIHTLAVIDYWLDFLGKETLKSKSNILSVRARERFEEYGSFDDVKAYMRRVEKRMDEYLQTLSPTGLKKCTVTVEKHRATKISAEDILIHVFEEEVHHRGELIALFWQMRIDPPEMGWKGL